MNLAEAFDPEVFRAEAHRLVDGLADYLVAARAGEMPVLRSVPPESLLEHLPADFPEQPADDLVDALLDVVALSNHVHHPRYIGHQVAVGVPSAALAEMTTALLNNGMAIYEMGQMHTVMERHVIAFLGRKIGFRESADGVLTNGGTIGNLTALLAARQSKAGYDVWAEGQRRPFAVLVSDQAHYCIARSAQLMGWGAGGAVPVATDADFRLRVDGLRAALSAARADDRQVLAVVASACSTATGTFDPLDEIADFCAEEDLWMHVDGAHGASFLLSERHGHRLAGIERADSVVWDLHKTMMLPALNSAVVFRDGRRSYEAFAQEASYLFGDVAPEDEWFNIGHRTFECTKRGLGVTAYTILRSRGTAVFSEYIDRVMELTMEFADKLEAAEDFELAMRPEANIICFRHRAADDRDLDAHQTAVRSALVASGEFYIVQAGLRGSTWLRATIMNPATSAADFVALMDEIRKVGR